MTLNDQKPLRFLLAQDSTISAIELECVLEDLGHRVVQVAVTPADALARLHNASATIDAVIFDAMQLGLPTYEFARASAQLGVASVVTSDFPEAFVRVLGFDHPYISKPYKFADVAAVTAELSPREVAPAAA